MGDAEINDTDPVVGALTYIETWLVTPLVVAVTVPAGEPWHKLPSAFTEELVAETTPLPLLVAGVGETCPQVVVKATLAGVVVATPLL